MSIGSDRSSKLLSIGIVVAIFSLPMLVALWMTSVPGLSFSGRLSPLSSNQIALSGRLRDTVTAIASEPHNIEHPAVLEGSARSIERSLLAAGYPVRRQWFRAGNALVRNIDVVVQPARADSPTLVIGAHYDSCLDAPGANDNGSGVAAALELARHFAARSSDLPVRLRIVFFVNEEPPNFQTATMGSLVYAKRLQRSGEQVEGMFSLETIGFYSDRPHSQRYPFPLDILYPDTGNFIAFAGMTSSRSLVRKTTDLFRRYAPFPSEGGTAPGFVQGIDWSDHWSFAQVGIPALMVTDTAPFRYHFYHTTADTPDKVDYDRLARVVEGLEAVIDHWR